MVTEQEAKSWTAPGAQDAAQRTYASVKEALNRSSRLAGYDYEVFLQGSYANATNIRGDSDVDIVAMLKTTFIRDTSRLSAAERQREERRTSPATVTVDQFRQDVHSALVDYYGSSRIEGRNKCIRVAGRDGYLDADVVPAYQLRRYMTYPEYGEPRFIEGIQIRPLQGEAIVNYPKEHRDNGATKNTECSDRYKPTVRQVKRLAVRAIDKGLITRKEAPGYVLECMVFNVNRSLFAPDDQTRLLRVVLDLHHRTVDDLRQFKSGDLIHRLFVDDPGGHNEYTAKRVLGVLWDVL